MDSQPPLSGRRIASAHSLRSREASRSREAASERSVSLPADNSIPPASDAHLDVGTSSTTRSGERSSSFSSFIFTVGDFSNNMPNPFDPSPRKSPQTQNRELPRSSPQSSHAKSRSVDAAIDAFKGFNISERHGPSTDRPLPQLFSIGSRSSLSPFQSPNVSRASSEDPFAGQEDLQLDEALVYDPSTEAVPDHIYFSAYIQNALKKAKILASEVASTLEDYADADSSQVDRLTETAKRCAQEGGDSSKSVAILGDSGTGKSSLINSLLSCPGLAYAGGSGEAVTSVVTEFRMKTDGEPAPFKIEMQFCDDEQSRELLKELVWSYRHLRLVGEDSSLDDEDFKRLQVEHETAWSSLNAAFGHHGELKRLLDKTAEVADTDLVDQLLSWKSELAWPDGHANGRWSSSVDSADECCEMTSRFMEDRFWPFIKIIRVYLKAQVLENGLVLVDLPGLRDVNLAKVKLTEEYLLQTDHIFITARIDRAISDRSLKESLFGALRRHVPNEIDEHGTNRLNVTVICTRAEPSDDTEIAQLRREYVTKRKIVDKQKIDELDKRLQNAARTSNQALKKQVKQELRYILMKARNDDVTAKLRRAYENEIGNQNGTSGSSLEVFCVANSAYQKSSKKGDPDGVHASGIPALRSRCQLISADARLAEVRNFLSSTLPGLLQSIKLWIERLGGQNRQGLENREEAQKQLDDLTTLAQNIINDVKVNLTTSFRDNISKLMDFQLRNGKWSQAAKSQSSQWKSWHHMSYSAWCNHDGTHSTPARGFRRWNNELIWKMREEILAQWHLFEDEIAEEILNATERIETVLTDLSNAFETIENFAQALRLQIDNIKYRLGVVAASSRQQAQLLLRKITEDNSTSFILQAMRPAYCDASCEFGTGSGKRRIAHVEGRIGNGLFEGICANIDLASEKLIANIQSEVKKALDEILAKVRADFDVAFESAAGEEEQHPAQDVEELNRTWEGWQEEVERIGKEVEDGSAQA